MKCLMMPSADASFLIGEEGAQLAVVAPDGLERHLAEMQPLREKGRAGARADEGGLLMIGSALRRSTCGENCLMRKVGRVAR